MIRNLESLMTTYMICNLVGLSSTCTNPILYGYLNKNIQEVVMKSVSDVMDRFCDCFDANNVSYDVLTLTLSLKCQFIILLCLFVISTGCHKKTTPCLKRL